MKMLKILCCFSMLFFGSMLINSSEAQAGDWWTLYEVTGDDGTVYYSDCLPVMGGCFVVTPEQ